jgi:hypothetical protein
MNRLYDPHYSNDKIHVDRLVEVEWQVNVNWQETGFLSLGHNSI